MPSSKVIPIPMSLERTGLLPAYQNILSVLSSKTSPAYHTKTGVYKVALDILRARLEEHGKAESIQRIHRGRKARRDLEEKKEAAVRLQGVARVRKAKKDVGDRRSQNAAATKMQAVQRRRNDAARVKEMKEQKGAAVRLQSIQRGRATRRDVKDKAEKERGMREEEEREKEGAATKVQSVFRRRESMKEVEGIKEMNEMNGAASALQKNVRSRQAKLEFQEKRAAVGKLQAAERGRKGRKKAEMMQASYKGASVLQARVRGSNGRKDARQAQRMSALRPVGEICVGDVVKAKLMGEAIWCEGIVIARSGEGDGGVELDEWDIDFGEGEVQEHVPSSSMRKVLTWDALEIGDFVKAPVPGLRGLKADAEIQSLDRIGLDGKQYYTIKFTEDDEVSHDVCIDDLVKCASKRMKAVVMWKKGGNAIKAISAFSDKKWGAYRRLSTVEAGIAAKMRRNSKDGINPNKQ
ncbi:hypothetical protein TrCOL_g4444 [Triparma columacea]|uniref:Uncharacterized protein n=1 Tax=Triparma columacea TaxID=722753 RepID=A0A9W7L6H1_9STRA|nr:hypothetical protein TrCOL_g4444 [Triparma columacea]